MEEWIELSVIVDGQNYAVRENLPDLMKVSMGSMSMAGAMSGAVERLTKRLAEIIDVRMSRKHIFIPWRTK